MPVSCDTSCYIVQSLSHVRHFATPWTAARQVSLSFTVSQSLHRLVSIESILPDLIAEDLRSQRCNTSKGPGAGKSTVISDSMSCSPPGSSVHGILQARILERVTIPFYRGSS